MHRFAVEVRVFGHTKEEDILVSFFIDSRHAPTIQQWHDLAYELFPNAVREWQAPRVVRAAP